MQLTHVLLLAAADAAAAQSMNLTEALASHNSSLSSFSSKKLGVNRLTVVFQDD